jgi:hypothetical protein
MKWCRIGLAAAALTLTALESGAQAQMMGGAGGGGGSHKQHQQKASTKDQAPKADEKAYAAALKTVPDRPFDPWHGVR